MHLRCPHCTNAIEIVDVPSSGDMLCPSCGSHFSVGGDTTLTWGKAEAGQRLGRFALLEMVGRGAFGAVYKAKDPELDREVAIKVPRAGNLASDDHRERFLREARSVAQLRHPGIVPVHEVGQANGMPYLVSDFIHGVTLADQLSKGRALFADAVRIMIELADAIQYAHEQKVIHRDLKPSNIMIDGQGKIHVMDFGLAKRDAGEIALTMDGQILGTPAYMSPEQAGGDGLRADGRSDIYSLGVILYQLLTGEVPFRGTTRMLLVQVQHDEPQAPRTLDEKIPRDLETICLKAMAKEPGKRYQRAADLADELRRFQGGQPILARPASRLEKTWRWCRRNPKLATAYGCASFGLLATAIISTWFGIYQGQAAEEIRQQEKQTAAALVQSQRFAATMAMDQGLALRAKGEAGPGMLWLARALEIVPGQAKELERAIRVNLADWKREVRPLLDIYPHDSNLESMALSPDGKTLATGCIDGRLFCHDLVRGQTRFPPCRHQGGIVKLAFSPDGKLLAAGDYSGYVQMWDPLTGKAHGPLLKHLDIIDSLAFSPDGLWLATGCGGDAKARLWKTSTGEAVGPPMTATSRVPRMAFSPDSKQLALCDGNPTARIYEVGTGKLLRDLGGQERVENFAYSKDGKYFVTVGVGPSGKLWDAASGKFLGITFTHQGKVQEVAFSPDGTAVATGSVDQTARLWRTATGQPIGVPMANPGGVSSLTFNADGTKLLTGSFGGLAQLWDAATALPLGGRMVHADMVVGAAFSPDGKTLLTASSDGAAKIWDAAVVGPPGFKLQANGPVQDLAFSPNGKLLGAGDYGSTAHLWETATGRRIGKEMRESRMIWGVAFGPQGDVFLTGSDNWSAQLWDTATAQKIGEPCRHPGPVDHVAYDPKGKFFVTASHDKGDYSIRFWDATNRQPLGPPQPAPGLIHRIALSPDGSKLAAGCGYDEKSQVPLWDTATRQPFGKPIQHGTALVVAFSPDGKTLLTAGADKMARLWDVATGHMLHLLPHVSSIQCGVFSPDGKYVATGATDRLVRRWSCATGKVAEPLYHHGDVILDVAFSPDGNSLLSASGDGLARLWDVSTGRVLGMPTVHPAQARKVAYANDALIASGCETGLVHLRPVPQPWPEDADTINQWIKRATGLTLDPASLAILPLEPEVWRQLPRP